MNTEQILIMRMPFLQDTVTLTWEVPTEGDDERTFTIVGTVVKDHKTFWVDIKHHFKIQMEEQEKENSFQGKAYGKCIPMST